MFYEIVNLVVEMIKPEIFVTIVAGIIAASIILSVVYTIVSYAMKIVSTMFGFNSRTTNETVKYQKKCE